MKNTHLWRPSKFIYKNGKLRASSDAAEVSIASWFVADIVAAHYDTYLKDHARGRLADLGCGKIPLYAVYKNYVSDCICADWENTKHTNPFLDITCNLNSTLPFANKTFNTIILSDVLEHIAHPEKLWLEMNRVLQPGGKVILNVPFFYKLHETPNDYFRFTKYALANFSDASGFTTTIIKETGGLPEILTDLLAKLVVSIPGIGRILSIFFQKTGRYFVQTYIGKKLSTKTREHFPLGYFMIAEKVS